MADPRIDVSTPVTDHATEPLEAAREAAERLGEEVRTADKISRSKGPQPDPRFEVADAVADAAAEEQVDTGDADPTVLDFGKLRRYRELREAQAVSEAEAKAMKDEADALQDELIDMFTEAGMQNIQVDGKTIYLHRAVVAARCPGITAEDVKEALRAAGAGDLVTTTVNSQTLSAWVRELTEDDDAPGLPEPVVGVLEPFERFSIRINAAGSRPKSKTRSK